MSYSIIGTGQVGAALARQFARSGIAVGIANTRGAQAVEALAKELGPEVTPLGLAQALEAEVIILAVPFKAHRAVAAALPNWSGKTVIDAMNTHGIPSEELQGRASTDVVATAFRGARVVKTFNQLPAKLLAQNPADQGGRRVMFLSSNHIEAEAEVAELVTSLGFAPIRLGKVNEGGRLIVFGGLGMSAPLVLKNIVMHF